ncbi:ribonuclease III [bacterium]|nr:ribonuclease III [bacterium]
MKIERKINYKFKNQSLLSEALTHSSYANESSKKDNERLEFLGDAIISFIVTKHLFSIFPEYDEGRLSKLKNQIVSTKSFYKIVKKNKLETYLLLGKGEIKSGGKKRESNLAGLFEAIVGAIFKDSGIRSAEAFLKKFLLDQDFSNFIDEDYKSILQVESQKKLGVLPKYVVEKQEGPPHKREFHVSVFINKNKQGKAKGKSKKDAENKAAKTALKKLKKAG